MDALTQLKLLTEETGPEAQGTAVCESADAVLSPRMFTDEELLAVLELYEDDVYASAYHVLLRKAQSTKATIAGLTLPENERYWLRLAAGVRRSRSHAAERADQV